MVRYLLQEDLRTVLEPGLVRLTQDGVQRLVEEVCLVDVVQRDSDHVFHPLNWVSGEGCSRKVDRGINGALRDGIQDGLWRHGLDRERDLVQLELSGQQHPSNLFDKILHGTSVFVQKLLVIKGKATILSDIRRSEVIAVGQDLEVPREFNQLEGPLPIDDSRQLEVSLLLLIWIAHGEGSIRVEVARLTRGVPHVLLLLYQICHLFTASSSC